MDSAHFDQWTRTCSLLLPRRPIPGLVAILALARPSDLRARKKRKKKRCPPCKKRKKGKCKKTLPDGTPCPGGSCHNGLCAADGNGCPDQQKPCGTECILAGECCTDADCPTGTTCCGHLCVDTTSDPRHCGGCAMACAAAKTCAGGRCCTARHGVECMATSECCGTDVCDLVPASFRKCVACVPEGSDCEYNPCCPRLFCVNRIGTGSTCVLCKLTGESCQSNVDCCQGLFCQSGSCAPPGTG